MTKWGSPSEQETRRRIKLCVWAYAYEIDGESLVADHVFDREALAVDLRLATSRPEMDDWFRKNFDPSTGMWIRNHPDLTGIEKLYRTTFKPK